MCVIVPRRIYTVERIAAEEGNVARSRLCLLLSILKADISILHRVGHIGALALHTVHQAAHKCLPPPSRPPVEPP